MKERYDSLWLACLDEAGHDQTCGYWYTVTNHSTPHTAFRTKSALLAWLDRRGLALTIETPAERGVHQSQAIKGSFVDWMHPSPESMATHEGAIGDRPFLLVSNGRYTMAFTTEAEGVRTVHYLNPNCDRVEVDYSLARNWEDRGQYGLPPVAA